MAADSEYSPQVPGSDIKAAADVDRTDVATRMRDGSTKAHPSMGWLDDISALFMRWTGKFTGLDADGKRMGELVVSAGSSLTNLLSSLWTGVVETSDLLEVIDSRATNALHELAKLTPLGAIYRSATASAEVTRSDPEWSHYNGPTQFISIAGVNQINGTVTYVLPTLDYANFFGQITWTNNGLSTQQIRIYGHLDDTAWAAVGAVADYRDIQAWTQLTPNSSPGFNVVAGAGNLEFRVQNAHLFREIAIEVITTNSNLLTSMSGWYGLAGQGH